MERQPKRKEDILNVEKREGVITGILNKIAKSAAFAVRRDIFTAGGIKKPGKEKKYSPRHHGFF